MSRFFDDCDGGAYQSSIRMVSLHHDPADEFPYASGFAADDSSTTYNHPLPSGTTWKQYSAALAEVLDTHVGQWQPDFVVVAFGGGTFKLDSDVFPQSNRFALEVDDYASMGAQIRAAVGARPMLVTQEGGYCMEAIGHIVARFLTGLAGHQRS